MALHWNKRLIVGKIESSYGVDSNPTGAANALLCRNVDLVPLEGKSVDLAYIRPYFGAAKKLRVESYAKLSFELDFVGKAGGIAGVAQPWGFLLRSCGCSETVSAADVDGAAQSGSTATAVKLAAGASAVDDLYVGATLCVMLSATPHARNIVDYNGATKVATLDSALPGAPSLGDGYKIYPYTYYQPITDSPESCTLYFYIDGVLHVLLGARGTFSAGLKVGEAPSLKFELTGLLGTIADATAPTPTLTAFGEPLAVGPTNTGGLIVHGYTGAIGQEFTLEAGNQVTFRQLIGLQEVALTDRASKGSCVVEATTVAAKDWWTPASAGTTGRYAIQHGTPGPTVSGSVPWSTYTNGDTVRIDIPAAQPTDPKYQESDGVAMLSMGMNIPPASGNDEWRITVK